MLPRSQIAYIRIHPLAIPLRRPFEHAAHKREHADPVIVEIELADHTVGYGETLPRPYVSGETVPSVTEAVARIFLPELLSLRPETFADALEQIDALPAVGPDGKVINAARAGVELALLDAYSRHFRTPISEAVGWLGLPGFGAPGSTRHLRYSGVLSGGNPARLKRRVRMMRWVGLRDFKLKVGYEDDAERVRAVAAALGRSLTSHPGVAPASRRCDSTGSPSSPGRRTTLRLDANGAWTLEQATARLKELLELAPIASVEQPLSPENDDELLALRRAVPVPIMVDESLVTLADAERLAGLGLVDAFNIRISKNGGFLAALRLAHFARKNGLGCQLGCMVGETSILSAAGRRFLENVPGVAFAEGSYGRFLLTGDVVARPVQIRCGARIKPLPGLGWGIDVAPDLLHRYTSPGTFELPL